MADRTQSMNSKYSKGHNNKDSNKSLRQQKGKSICFWQKKQS